MASDEAFKELIERTAYFADAVANFEM